MMILILLLGCANFILLFMFQEHEVQKCVCMSPTVETSSRSLGWSHRGRLRRQPSWKQWYRPGTVCFRLKAFCLLQNRIIPHLHFFLPPFSLSPPPPPSVLPPSVSAMQIVSFANLKKTSEWMREWGMGGWRDEPPAKEGVPLTAHTPPPPFTLSSRYPPQLIWIN